MKKNNSAAAFLANMKINEPDEAPVTKKAAPATASITEKPKKAPNNSRDGLKHIGGYLDVETVEKVAILRARLNMDNSQLITEAINQLFSKQQARKAFND